MVQTAFVTGGSGFVGRNLIQALREAGWEVRALVRSTAAERTVRELGATAVEGDLDSVAVLEGGLRGASAAFHAAAKVEDWGPRTEFHRINVQGTQNVIEAARRAGVPRLVHVSTEAVLLGGGPIVRAREERPIASAPPGLYPWSKALAEKRVVEANSPELTTVVVRPRFVWGLGDTTLLPKLSAAVRNGSFRWIGGGRHLTSSCHVRNLAAGMIRAAEAGKGGGVYFLTDGEPVVMRSFLEALLETQGLAAGDQELPLWMARLGARAAELTWTILRLKGAPPVTRTAVDLIGQEVTVDDRKARAELGYRNVISREDGLRELRTRSTSSSTAAAQPIQIANSRVPS